MPELIVSLPNGNTIRRRLATQPVVLGRDPTCDVPLEDPSTSRKHACITFSNGQYTVEDMKSKNGTVLNDVTVERGLLRPGDVVMLGAVRVLFQDDIRPAAAPAVSVVDQAPSDKSTHFSALSRDLQLPRGRLQMLYDLSDRLTKLRHSDELLQDALDICFETLRFERGAIAVRKPSGRGVDWPVVRNLYGRSGELTVSRTILGRALNSGERAIINDAGEEMDPTTSIVQQGIRSAMCVPLAHRDQILGVIYGDRTTGGTVYTEEDVDFLAALARLVTIGLINSQLMREQAEKIRLENEMSLARQIQQGLFPKQLPESGRVRFAVLNEPGSRISGDYYDVLTLTDGRIGFLIADVSGKGMAAAMLMANLQAAVRVTLPTARDLPSLLRGWNALIYDNTDGLRFVTLLLGVLDAETRRLTLICAGHPPPYLLCGDQDPTLLAVEPGFPLGSMRHAEYEPIDMEVPSTACTLFGFTDGVTEAMDTDQRLFGKDRMINVLLEHPKHTPDELIKRMLQSIHEFRGPAEPSDDITMLAVRLD